MTGWLRLFGESWRTAFNGSGSGDRWEFRFGDGVAVSERRVSLDRALAIAGSGEVYLLRSARLGGVSVAGVSKSSWSESESFSSLYTSNAIHSGSRFEGSLQAA